MLTVLHSLSDQAILAALRVSYRKVGGLRFLKVGRLSLSFCVTRVYRPIGG
jgi:hypothetical protein